MLSKRDLKFRTKEFFLNRGYQIGGLRPLNLARTLVCSAARRLGYEVCPIVPEYPLYPAIDPHGVAVLADPEFKRSVKMAAPHSKLDVARMANLWSLARLTGPGVMIEVGTYLGGTALHISNSWPNREMYIFDTFTGFRSLTSGLDDAFGPDQFKDTTDEYVRKLFRPLKREVKIVKGYFPDSTSALQMNPIAFCHLDVDVYDATLRSLLFLRDKMARRSLIVLDDYLRDAGGVDRAAHDFLVAHEQFTCLPLFPGQGVLFSRDLWS